MDIGARIRKERERRGWTQEEMATRCGYQSKTSISKIESAGDDISSKKVRLIANVLNVPVSYLMGWEATNHAVDKELAELLNSIRDKEEMKMLFKAAQDATPEQLQEVASFLNYLKKKSE